MDQLEILEYAMTYESEFPEMREEVRAALRSLSDPKHQRERWGKYDEDINYYDDLTMNIHILYDDCAVLPEPQLSVPSLLRDSEVESFNNLENSLEPLVDELGDRSDSAYLADPRWKDVITAAEIALKAMESD